MSVSSLPHNVKALLSGFEFEKQMYMTKEQLSNMACEAYNSLGMNPPHYHWMDGFVAGYLAHQQNLQQCNVSGTVCEGCKFDRKCNLQDQGRYKEICSHFEQTDR